MSTSGIYGLSGSGIDVDSMVKVGMLSKQNEYDKLYKKEVQNTWMKEAYADLYSDVSTFANSTLSTYKMSYTTNPMTVSSSSTSVATAVANSNAVAMAHTVTVSATASNAYMLTDDKIKRANANIMENGKATGIKLADVIFTDAQQTSLKSQIQSGSLNGDDTALSFTLKDSADASDKGKTISFTYDELLSSGQTLNDLVSKINNSGLNISASYDSTNDAFSMYQKDSGSKNAIAIEVADDTSSTTDDNARTLINSLQLKAVTTTSKDGTATSTMGSLLQLSSTNTSISATGSDATAVIDGKTYTASSNKISAANVTYTLTSTGSSTMTVSQDTDKAIENVKKFVEDYNKMMDSLNDKFNEKQYSDYGPLTKSQENSMTQDQIDKWNKKAKSGLLYHDTTLNKIRSAMREALYTPVDSVDSSYNTMMSLGIESSTDQGHLTLDENKLKKALAADPDCVYQIFASKGETTTKLADGSTTTTTDYDKEGVVNRLYDSLNTQLKDLKSYAGTSSEADDGSSLGTLLKNLQDQMSDFKTKMDAYEKALYSKYDDMESAIAKLSAQFNFVSGR
ncbi:MAG: flagellar filament capping protein FliD [Selenomonadaceae bacterium]|nr:flagellar filament capping protein FliD [Selenomonadaceae bacterium]